MAAAFAGAVFLTATSAVASDPEIPKAGWSVVFVDSEETITESAVAANAFDGNPGTFWHTQYTGGSPGHLHQIQIDLGATYEITGFRYLARQDGSDNGRIKEYRFYISDNTSNYGPLVVGGELADNANEQQVLFNAKSGRYIQFVSYSAYDNNPWAAIAELTILQNVAGNLPPNAQITSPSSNITITAGESVTFAASANDNNNGPADQWNTPFTYLWTFGEGSGIADFLSRNPGSRTFNVPGVYSVRLRVADSLGLVDPTPAARTITVLGSSSATFLSQAGWTVAFVDSQHSANPATAAFDGDPTTFWHTQANPVRPPPPHEVRIDLGAVYNVSGFNYLPRQDDNPNGNIGQYEFYTSLNGSAWGSPVVAGEFPNSPNAHEVYFPTRSARYVRMRALTEVNGQPFTTIAELNVILPGTEPNDAPDGTIVFPAVNPTITAGSTLDLMGTGTDPDGDTPLRYRWTILPGSGILDSTAENPGLVRFNIPGTYEVTFFVADSLGLVDPTPAKRTVTVLGASGNVAKTNWSLQFVDSEEIVGENAAAINAFDGNVNTLWHTQWKDVNPIPRLPHEIQIDLGEGYDIGGFRYVPRQDASPNGRIGNYRVYVSADGSNWGGPVAAGTFVGGNATQDVQFTPKIGRYLRVRALSALNGDQFTAAAEFGVLESPALTPTVRLIQPTTGQVQTGPEIHVLADASLQSGQGIRLEFDGGTANGGSEVVDYTAPYQATFMAAGLASHTIDAFVVDASGTKVVGPGTRDRAQNVGIGDYYVAIGDSITYGIGDDLPADDATADGTNIFGGYSPILAELLTGASGRRTMIMNEGIPGSRTLDAVTRVLAMLKKHPNARRFLVMVGTNDTGSFVLPSGLGKQPGQTGYAGSFKEYLQLIIDEVNNAGKSVILAEAPPTIPAGGSRDLLVQQLNAVMAELAAVPANNIPVPPVDVHGALTPNASIAYFDAVHPNGLGYQIIAETFFDALSSTPAAGAVSLSNLSHIYDGNPKSPTATTTPANLAVSLTFNGSSTAPTDAGSYAVVATITDFAYSGTANGTMTISPAPATITLSNLSQSYNATPRSATVTTVPGGLPVNVTYNGSATAPTDVGSYAVLATVNSGNHSGVASGTLEIFSTTAAINLSNMTQTYDGAPKPVTVTTVPAGLAVNVTYNGSTTVPSAAGTYAVTATFVDTNIPGSASGTLTINKRAATVTLSNLVQPFNGQPRSVGVTTSPAGLSVAVTYSGSATTPTAGGTYTVEATVADPNHTGSASDSLVIWVAPSISQHPENVTATIGGSATFGVFASGSPALAYQWRLGGVDIPGATAATYTVSNVQMAAAGSYSVRVSNIGGNVVSNAATLQVFAPFSITAQPNGVAIPAGASATLSVSVTGAGHSFQWYRGASGDTGSPVAGALSATLITPVLDASTTYWVRVSTPAQIANSESATVTVIDSTRTFFGTFGSDADARFGLIVRLSGTAEFLAHLPGLGVCVESPAFTVAGDGTFSFLVPGVGTFNGRIIGGTVSGSVAGTSLTFSGTQDNPTGATAALAGLYRASVLETSSRELVLIAGSAGRAFVVSGDTATRSGVLTSVAANGAVAALMPNGSVVALMVNASMASVTGTISQGLVIRVVQGSREEVPVIKRLDNVSMRGEVQGGDSIMIAGFVVSGQGEKRVLIRGIGPTLSAFNVPGALSDAKIELYRMGTTTQIVAENDNWGQAANASEVFFTGRDLQAFDLDVNSKDAALLVNLPAGSYTAHVRGVAANTGRALVEVYDADSLNGPNPSARLANISMRGQAGSGDDVVIAGFVVAGDAPKRVLVRAVGPELAGFGVSGVLADPTLSIFKNVGNTTTKISDNDNWGTDAAVVAEASASVNAFALTAGSASAAKVIWLAPGVYTAHAASANTSKGITLVEVYELP